MSLTSRVLIGLVAGFLIGLGLAGVSPALASRASDIVTPIGAIFVNLIRMTVIPLVTTMLVASVGSVASTRSLGRIGARAAVLAVALLAITAVVTLAVALPVLARVPIDAAAAMALRGSAAT